MNRSIVACGIAAWSLFSSCRLEGDQRVALVSLAVTPTNPSMAIGMTRDFTATGIFSDASSRDLTSQVTWASADGAIATISSNPGSKGLAAGAGVGSTTITATLGGLSGTTTLTITAAALLSIEVSPATPSIAKGTELQLAATGLFSDLSTQDLTSQVSWASSNEAVAAISNAAGSNGLATAVGLGTTTLSASLSGVDGTTALTVTDAALLSIDVTPTNPSIPAGLTQPLAATGTYTDGSTQDLTSQVTWLSSDDSVATISNAAGSNGLATAVGLGTTTLSAWFSGVVGATTLTITDAALLSIDVTPTDPWIAAGSTQQFAATGTFTDSSTQELTRQVTWGSSDAATATISNAGGSNGLAAGIGVGTTTISASLSGVGGTTALTVTDSLLLSIDVTPTNLSIAAGTTQQLTATGTFSDASVQDLTDQVTWATSDGAIATISNAAGSKGLATGVGPGSATITATLSGASGTTTFTVTAAALLSIEVSPATPSIAQATTQQFAATGVFSDGTKQDLTTQVAWASSDGAIATISNAAGSNGLATGVAGGSTTITATFSGVSGTTTLTVTSATLSSIDVTPTNPAVAAGTTRQFTATGTFSDASAQDLTSQVTWTSSDGAIATISNVAGNNGLATGVGAGSATITATLSGVSGTTTITVSDAVLVSIAVAPTDPSVAAGSTQQFSAIGTFSDASTQDLTSQVTWTSSDGAIATISNAAGSNGLSAGVGVGTTTISATLSSVSGSTTLTVTNVALVSISIAPAGPTLPVGFSDALAATGVYSDGSTAVLTTQVAWGSSSTTVATISNGAGTEGLATGVAAGQTTITATFSGIVGTTTLTVSSETLGSIVVAPATVTLALTETQQMTASGTFSGGTVLDITTQVKWSSNDRNVATVNNTTAKGFVAAQGSGSATIKASKGNKNGTATVTVP